LKHHPAMLTIFSKQSIATPSNKLFLFFVIIKEKSIFSWKLSSKMLVLKKVKSHSEKKDGKFLSTEKNM